MQACEYPFPNLTERSETQVERCEKPAIGVYRVPPGNAHWLCCEDHAPEGRKPVCRIASE
jgi:hypothetical protein